MRFVEENVGEGLVVMVIVMMVCCGDCDDGVLRCCGDGDDGGVRCVYNSKKNLVHVIILVCSVQ